MKKDDLTYQVSRAINILFLYNVIGTSYGVLLGVLVLSFQELLASILPPFGLIKWYGFIVLGVLIFNIKPIIKKKYIDPNIEKQLIYVRQLIKEGKLSAKEKKEIYRKLIITVIEGYNEKIEMTRDHSDSHNPTPE